MTRSTSSPARAPPSPPATGWASSGLPRARNKIRQWFARERREDALAQGREALVQAMRKQGLPVEKISKGQVLETVANELHYPDLDSMHVAIGEGRLSTQSVTSRVIRLFEPEAAEDEDEDVDFPSAPPRSLRKGKSRGKGVIVEGHDDLLVRLARCCTPVPGDQIVGFLTRGRGVSVHRIDCPNAVALRASNEEGRMIDVWWDSQQQGTFIAAIQIEALDRAKLLRDVTAAISDQGIHILSSTTRTGRDGIAALVVHVRARRPESSRACPVERQDCGLGLRRVPSRSVRGQGLTHEVDASRPARGPDNHRAARGDGIGLHQ